MWTRRTTNSKHMKRILHLLLALILLPSFAVAQGLRQSNLSAPRVLGSAVASEFGNWSIPIDPASAFSTTGSHTVQVIASQVDLPGGTSINPFVAGSPLYIADPANPETVTIVSANCSAGSFFCTFTATFTYAHPSKFNVQSGTKGLQEAVNYMHFGLHGGMINVTPSDWGGTTAMITDAVGYSDVSIFDLRSGNDLFYTWDGTDYVITWGVYVNGGVTPTTIAQVSVINNIRYCNQFTGANAGLKLVSCMTNLPSTGGIADWGVEGSQTITADPFIGVTKPVSVWCAGATFSFNTDVTIPANVTVHFGEGCVFTGSGTLTFNGHVDNPQRQQIFSTTLSLKLATDSYPEWWGAKADGLAMSPTDNSTAFQAAVDAYANNTNPYNGNIGPSGGGFNTINFGAGVYQHLTGVTVANSGIHIRCAGNSSTILRFNPPSGPAVAWTFNAGEELHDSDFSNCTLDATNSSLAVVKTALYLYDVAEFTSTNLTIRDYSDSTHESLCVELHGREQITFTTYYFFCNRPLYVGADPETMTEGLDRSSFKDGLFAAIESIAEGGACVNDQPNVEITEADAFLTDVTFDGWDFICGSHSVFWENTNAKTSSFNVKFTNGRNEQGAPDWGFYIHPPANNPVFNLKFDTVHLYVGTKGGWRLRNVFNGSMDNVLYGASASVAPLDADSTAVFTPTNANWNVHSAGNYNALNGWCGIRYNEDQLGGSLGTGQIALRSCGQPQVILENVPGGTTFTISAASCVGSMLAYTIGAHVFEVGALVTVAGVMPAGLNGTFTIAAVTATTVKVRNGACPLTYSSGGAGAMTYGALAYLGHNLMSDMNSGDLGLRSDGILGKIVVGVSGAPTAAFTANWLQFYNAAGDTVVGYVGSKATVTTDWTTDDMQIRSDGGNILFSQTGATTVHMPLTGISLDSATPTVTTGQIGLGNSLATTATNGTGEAMKANVEGYIIVNVEGTTVKVPYVKN